MPRIVDDFIRNTDFSGELSAYFILTCGDGTGNAVKYCKQICAEKGLKFMGMASIIMPENYIAMFSVPNKSEAKQIIKKAIPQILSIAEQIKAKKSLTLEKVSLAGKIASGLVNPLFYRLFIKDKGFYTTSKCTGCGKCVQLCTVNNISIINNRPQWNGNCIHCMACISGCPTLAIEYKNRSKGKSTILSDLKSHHINHCFDIR